MILAPALIALLSCEAATAQADRLAVAALAASATTADPALAALVADTYGLDADLPPKVALLAVYGLTTRRAAVACQGKPA